MPNVNILLMNKRFVFTIGYETMPCKFMGNEDRHALKETVILLVAVQNNGHMTEFYIQTNDYNLHPKPAHI
jgi:hypothetical protein